MLTLQEPRQPHPFSLFNLGFRPFFLFGAIAALTLIGHWIGALQSGWQPHYFDSSMRWHGHEMLFGFSLAIIAGFLLTAVRNWTHIQTAYGWKLAALVALWLCARILPFIEPAPALLVALTNLSFPALVALAIGLPILRAGNYRNLVFLVALGGFFIASLLVHLQLLGITDNTAHTGLYLGLYLIVLIIVILGGRVIPFFTERGIGNISCTRYAALERAMPVLMLVWLLTQLASPGNIAALSSLALAGVQLLRLAGWYHTRIWHHPLLWVLHLGYGFIVLGFGLQALAQSGILSQSIALHSFATGGIGMLTLGMMARVSLGHTGRPLHANLALSIAFGLMLISALIRISLTWLPLTWLDALQLSAGCWILAWLLFVVKYLPILIKPRADGLWG